MEDGPNDNAPVRLGKAIMRGIVPAVRSDRLPGDPLAPSLDPARPKQVTMAAMIYALGAGILFIFACYNLSQGAWFNGVVTFVPAGSLMLLAYKYLQ